MFQDIEADLQNFRFFVNFTAVPAESGQSCCGTFIATRWILTSAQCIEKLTGARDTLSITYWDKSQSVVTRSFKKNTHFTSYLHPNYSCPNSGQGNWPFSVSVSGPANIGLIKMFEDIGTYFLQLPGPFKDEEYINTRKDVDLISVSRSGRPTAYPLAGYRLRQIQLFSPDRCRGTKELFLYSDQVCSKLKLNQSYICPGDAGSPAHLWGDGMRVVFAVLNSMLHHCDNPYYVNFATYLRLSSRMSWILQTLEDEGDFTLNTDEERRELKEIKDEWSVVMNRELWEVLT